MGNACKLCNQQLTEQLLKGRTVALDVGHGWGVAATYDVGAMGNNTTEQVLNFKVASYAAELLRQLGATVHVFNYASNDCPKLYLREKGRRAGDVKADVFVSIHHNAFDGTAQGTETLVHSQATAADQQLANAIQKQLVDQLQFANRGIKWKNLGVLSGCPTDIPACLTEGFFIDWHGFNAKIDDDVLKRYAAGVAIGIKNFLLGD